MLDTTGRLQEFWDFKSEGPLIYERKNLKNDPGLLNHQFINSLNPSISIADKKIFYQNDTLIIEQNFPNQKILLIKQDKKRKANGRRILLEY